VEWARPDTGETLDCVGRVLCVRNLPSHLCYSSIVDIFNTLSGGRVETVVMAGQHVLVTFTNEEAGKLVRTREFQIEGKKIEVEPWRGYTRRRLDRGHQGQQTGAGRLPPPPILSSLLSSNTAEYELTNLCLSQGWGLPSFHVTGHKYDPVTLSELFQVSVTVPRLETPVAGPWNTTSYGAQVAAATQVLRQILRLGYMGPGSGLLSSGSSLGRYHGGTEQLRGNNC